MSMCRGLSQQRKNHQVLDDSPTNRPPCAAAVGPSIRELHGACVLCACFFDYVELAWLMLSSSGQHHASLSKCHS